MKKDKICCSIKIKYSNSWYGYQGRDGFALIINSQKMHTGLFNSVAFVREYWNNYRPMLCANIIPHQYK
jgi:hypothetical protein